MRLRMHTDSESTSLISTGLKTAYNILSLWECSSEQAQCILKLSKTSYNKLKTDPNTVKLNNEQLERISCLLNIHYALRYIFSNPENVRSFMRMKNHNDFFAGRTPLEIIEKGDFLELKKVATYIDILRSNL